MSLGVVLALARNFIREPEKFARRKFPADIINTPFPQIGEELASRIVQDFASENVAMTKAQWDRLYHACRWRISMMLYSIAYGNETQKPDEHEAA